MEQSRGSATAKGLGPWLARVAPRSAHGTVTIAILSDEKVRALNRRFRRINRATDVLSFPSQTRAKGKGKGARASVTLSALPSPLALFLGDIVIARGIARKQAENMGHSMAMELRVLALHGLLHLLGYDHQTDDGLMARTEARLRRQARLPPGLIARSS